MRRSASAPCGPPASMSLSGRDPTTRTPGAIFAASVSDWMNDRNASKRVSSSCRANMVSSSSRIRLGPASLKRSTSSPDPGLVRAASASAMSFKPASPASRQARYPQTVWTRGPLSSLRLTSGPAPDPTNTAIFGLGGSRHPPCRARRSCRQGRADRRRRGRSARGGRAASIVWVLPPPNAV